MISKLKTDYLHIYIISTLYLHYIYTISTLQLQAHEVGQHAGDELQQVHQEAEEAEVRLSLHQEQHTRRRGGGGQIINTFNKSNTKWFNFAFQVNNNSWSAARGECKQQAGGCDDEEDCEQWLWGRGPGLLFMMNTGIIFVCYHIAIQWRLNIL